MSALELHQRRLALALIGLLCAVFLVHGQVVAQQPATEILVTSAADVTGEGEEAAACPSEDRCTLRAAIEHVNAAEGDERYIIRFDTEVFAPEEPATIQVQGPSLPPVTRHNVTVDGAGAGVEIDGALMDGEGVQVGLWTNADNARIHGMAVRNFRGACILMVGDNATAGGSRDAGEGNTANSCGHGLVVGGENVSLEGNLVGLEPTPGGTPMDVAIEVYDGSATVGTGSNDTANYAGGAQRGIVVRTREASTSVASIEGNVLGRAPGGERAPLGYGVTIRPGAREVVVEGNAFYGVETAVAVLPAGEGSTASMQNTIRDNTFEDVGSLAIDLGNDGRTPNDASDDDTGPNGLLNAPEFRRVTQGLIVGSVPGPCGGCDVELYVAEQRFDAEDVPTRPIATATTTENGTFSFTGPAVAPGQWVTGTATDPAGNTSEFGESARVGAGVVQCSNGMLHEGWNSAGFFDSALALNATFPPESTPPGPVGAIHQLVSDGEYRSWFAGEATGDTLTRLETGEAYWFHAGTDVAIEGAVTLSEAFPVELEAGWNHFVYIGAEDDVRIALDSLEGQFTSLFRYDNEGDGRESWTIYGGPGTPEWVRGFTSMEPCQSYFINMTADATLEPPQP